MVLQLFTPTQSKSGLVTPYPVTSENKVQIALMRVSICHFVIFARETSAIHIFVCALQLIIMPYSHLACDESAKPLFFPYLPYCAASRQRQAAAM